MPTAQRNAVKSEHRALKREYLRVQRVTVPKGVTHEGDGVIDPAYCFPGIHWHRVGGKTHRVVITRSV